MLNNKLFYFILVPILLGLFSFLIFNYLNNDKEILINVSKTKSINSDNYELSKNNNNYYYNKNINIDNGFYLIVGNQKVSSNSKYVLSVLKQNTEDTVDISLRLSDLNNGQKEQIHNLHLDSFKIQQIEFNIGKLINPKLVLETNATLNGTIYRNSKKINFNKKSSSIFIQFDKPIYKPGDKVQFRVIMIDSNLLPLADGTKINIYAIDPLDYRIKQWLNVSIVDGIFTGYLELYEQQILGQYQLIVEEIESREMKSKKFDLVEYVLPEFDVKLIAPEYINYNDSELVVTVDARYTFDKPLNGIVNLIVKKNYQYQKKYSMAINGNVDISIDTSDLNLPSENHKKCDNIEITATVIETLSKKNFTTSSTVKICKESTKIRKELARIKILNEFDDYIPGEIFELNLMVVNPKDEPIIDSKNKLLLSYFFFSEENKIGHSMEKQFDLNGQIRDIKIDTPENSTRLFIKAQYKGLIRTYSFYALSNGPSNLKLNIMNKQIRFKIGEKVDLELKSNIPSNIINNYTVLILKNGNTVSATNYELKKQFKSEKISIDINPQLAPQFDVLVFFMTSYGMISAQKTILVDDLFINKIDLKLNKNQTEPGGEVNIGIKTSPNAFVGLIGIDQSVLLFGNNDITKQEILNDLKDYNNSVRHGSYSLENLYSSQESNNLFFIMNGVEDHFKFDISSYGSGKYIPISITKSENDLVIGDLPVKLPKPIKIRKKFPEGVWLFENLRSDEKNGTVVFSKKVPDTITSWFISAFALDKKTGLVINENPLKLTAFKPFFLKMNLPYSIVRGEIFPIQLLIFNYNDNDQKVKVCLENDKNQFEFISDNRTEIKFDRKEEIIDIRANDIASVSFFIKAKKTGNLILKASAITLDNMAGDKVEKILKVKSEGQTIYKNKAMFVNLKNNESNEQNFEIEFPENAIEGSKLIKIDAIGDILGTSMANINDLLRLPYGCGEQNMAKFVPNILVLDYLTNSKKLTNDIKDKAIRYLESGYRNQLNYRRPDGSFSAFGQNNENGSTWLTAFVLKSFLQAKKYIEIDTDILNSAIRYLVSRADYSGSNFTGKFIENGYVFHSALKGDVSKNSPSLSAYVLIALNKAKNKNFNVNLDLKKSENYLLDQSRSINLSSDDEYNYYKLAISAYALHEINSNGKDEVYQKLMSLDRSDKFSYNIPNSNIVEASSYALLTAIKRNNTSDALRILKWLISKQNNNGGFSTTTDTMIALEAIAMIASKLSVNDADLNIEFEFDGLESENFKPKFKINNQNSLELQTYQISEINFEKEFKKISKVKINSKGNSSGDGKISDGSAVLQIGLQYNIASKFSNDYFDLEAKTKEKNELQFKLEICTRYKKLGQTNMAVVEIELPSGYLIDEEKIDELKEDNQLIRRIDIKNSNTLGVFYFNKIDSNRICFDIDAKREVIVSALKKASIKVYDYYKIDENNCIFYLP